MSGDVSWFRHLLPGHSRVLWIRPHTFINHWKNKGRHGIRQPDIVYLIYGIYFISSIYQRLGIDITPLFPVLHFSLLASRVLASDSQSRQSTTGPGVRPMGFYWPGLQLGQTPKITINPLRRSGENSQYPLLSESPMDFLLISRLVVLPGPWLILIHLTLTSTLACPPEDTFDWKSVRFVRFYVEYTLTPV